MDLEEVVDVPLGPAALAKALRHLIPAALLVADRGARRDRQCARHIREAERARAGRPHHLTLVARLGQQYRGDARHVSDVDDAELQRGAAAWRSTPVRAASPNPDQQVLHEVLGPDDHVFETRLRDGELAVVMPAPHL